MGVGLVDWWVGTIHHFFGQRRLEHFGEQAIAAWEWDWDGVIKQDLT